MAWHIHCRGIEARVCWRWQSCCCSDTDGSCWWVCSHQACNTWNKLSTPWFFAYFHHSSRAAKQRIDCTVSSSLQSCSSPPCSDGSINDAQFQRVQGFLLSISRWESAPALNHSNLGERLCWFSNLLLPLPFFLEKTGVTVINPRCRGNFSKSPPFVFYGSIERGRYRSLAGRL